MHFLFILPNLHNSVKKVLLSNVLNIKSEIQSLINGVTYPRSQLVKGTAIVEL